MKTISKTVGYITLLTLCLIFSCETTDLEIAPEPTDDDSMPAPEVTTITEYRIEFTVTYEGPDGPITATQDDGPIDVCFEDLISIVNNSKEITITRENGVEVNREEKPYDGLLNLTVTDISLRRLTQAIPLTKSSLASGEALLYFFKFFLEDLSTQLLGEDGETVIAEKDFEGIFNLVNKDANAEPQCYPNFEESDDGRSTYFLYQWLNDQLLLDSAYKFLDDELQEITSYDYNEAFQLSAESFFTADNLLLGTRNMSYNTNNQLTSERVADANDNLVVRIGFNWDDAFSNRIPIGGTIEQPDGAGGTFFTDFNYSQNIEGTNVDRVDFFQNGTFLGYSWFEHNNDLKVFSNISYVQGYPEAFDTNSRTSERNFDALDNLLSGIDLTYQFNVDAECGTEGVTRTNSDGAFIDEKRWGSIFFF